MTFTAKNAKGKELGKYELMGDMLYINVDKSIQGDDEIEAAEEEITQIAEKKHKVKVNYTSYLNLDV